METSLGEIAQTGLFLQTRWAENMLKRASKRSRKNRSEIAREALRRQLRLEQFEEIRERIMPFAEAGGFLTDEDIFSKIS